MVALLNSAFLYVGSDKWTAVTAWTTVAVHAAGNLVRQAATPTVGNERVFVCIIAGTSLVSEPTWVVTKGATTAEAAGPTWQECTGQPGINGDITNSPVWGATLTVVKGQIIYDATSGALQICSTAGTTKSGTQPTFGATAGTTTTDNTVTWTSLGAASNFAAFAAPHARIANADAATWQTVVPATIYISSGHAATQATAITLAGGQGTAAKPNKYLCVSNATAPPTSVTTGASETCSGAADLIISGFGYYSGISFLAGSAANVSSFELGGSSAFYLVFENCTFKLNNTNSSSALGINASGILNACGLSLNTCTIIFGSVSQSIKPFATVNTFITGGSIALTGSSPSSCFLFSNSSGGGTTTIRDCDLSGLGGPIVTMTGDSTALVIIENCKLSANAPANGASSSPGAIALKVHNSDNGSKNYRFFEQTYMGSSQQETTTINTAGASDGTQGISFKAISTANSSFSQPFQLPEITQWQNTTGSSHTATVEIAGANTLTNGDIWMELEYPGSASFPIGSTVSSRVADAITAVSNVTTSAASWGGSPAHTQKLQVIFTPQMKGPIKARIYVAKASTTVFIDPLITVT